MLPPQDFSHQFVLSLIEISITKNPPHGGFLFVVYYTSQYMTLFLIFILGLCIGSFLNVIIIRLHDGASPLKGRSMCPQCKHTLAWYELIPLASFIIQQGRCRHCQAHISWQYPFVEFGTGVLFAMLSSPIFSYQFSVLSNFSITQLLNYLFLCILIVTFVTDLRWNLIYDAVVWPGIVLALLITLSPYHLLAALVGGGAFALQYILSRGAWVGSGDILLGAFLGLILGFPAILAALFLTYISGSLVALLLMSLGGKKTKDTLPLGCFMCAVAILLLLIR